MSSVTVLGSALGGCYTLIARRWTHRVLETCLNAENFLMTAEIGRSRDRGFQQQRRTQLPQSRSRPAVTDERPRCTLATECDWPAGVGGDSLSTCSSVAATAVDVAVALGIWTQSSTTHRSGRTTLIDAADIVSK